MHIDTVGWTSERAFNILSHKNPPFFVTASGIMQVNLKIAVKMYMCTLHGWIHQCVSRAASTIKGLAHFI